MNNCLFLLRITENPKQQIDSPKINSVKMKGNFITFLRQKKFLEIVNIVLWYREKITNDLLQCYRKGDFILIDGLLIPTIEKNKKTLKKKTTLEIHVKTAYLLFPTSF